jgi:signal peptidase II
LNGKAKEVKHRWVWLATVTAAGFLADIGTKHVAATRLTEGMPVNVAGEYLQWLLVYNTGAVFGTKPAELVPWLPANVFLTVFMLLSIAFLLFYYYALKKNETLMHIGLMLVLPGAFGNLYDRAVHGDKGVVDFIRMGFPPDNYWFIYNVADIFVTVGVAVMLLNFALEAFGKKPPGKAAAPESESIRKETDNEAES